MRKMVLSLAIVFIALGLNPALGGQIEPETDRVGQDYRSFNLSSPSPELCQQTCQSEGKCKAWTYVKPSVQGAQARCWLKHSVPAARRSNCCVSGVKGAAAAPAGNTVALQSVNYPDHYIRHQGYRGKITPIRSDLDRKDSSFVARGGLAGTGVSFESVNFPGYFLRHRSFEIWLDRYDGSDLFRKDATFTQVSGLAGVGVSFRSFNYPDRFIRHQGFLLYIHPFEESDLYRKDTSFQPRSASAGTSLYRSRWDKIGGPGGSWTTGWVPDVTYQGCGHQANGCGCGGQNYCGTYRSGDSTYWWPQGCNGPRWTIRCTSEPQ